MYDLAVLEFDLPHTSGQLKWQYVMASENYVKIPLSYSDAFVMGITPAGATSPTNVALVPGASTPIAVTTISPASNSNLYFQNTRDSSLYGLTYGAYHLAYAGFTAMLETAPYAVEAGKTYHVSLKLADGYDAYQDSVIW
jgi:hypothetical protein